MIDPFEGRDRTAQVKRTGHEDDRDDDRRLGERQIDPGGVQFATEQAEPTERGKQPEARDRGRQHQRQFDGGDRRSPATEAATRQDVRTWRSDDDRDRERDRVHLQ